MTELVETKPSYLEEVVEKSIWVDAMVEENKSIVKNYVWEIVPRPVNKLVVGSRWIFKVNHAENGSIEKYKARFLAKGYSQVQGVDYEETFSPVSRIKRALYSLKQAPFVWYTKINSYLTGFHFTKIEADANLYPISVEGEYVIIVLYVDDLILTSDEQLIISCKEDLAREFEMKNMGLMHYFLGLEVRKGDG
eukprot:PITA_03849